MNQAVQGEVADRGEPVADAEAAGAVVGPGQGGEAVPLVGRLGDDLLVIAGVVGVQPIDSVAALPGEVLAHVRRDGLDLAVRTIVVQPEDVVDPGAVGEGRQVLRPAEVGDEGADVVDRVVPRPGLCGAGATAEDGEDHRQADHQAPQRATDRTGALLGAHRRPRLVHAVDQGRVGRERLQGRHRLPPSRRVQELIVGPHAATGVLV